MKLEGGCHCGAVSFSVKSLAPVPYMRCYCSICRKTAGSGGYGINLSGQFDTLKVTGGDHVRTYQVEKCATEHGAGAPKGELSSGLRAFCDTCGTALWVYSPEWPSLVHPFAGVIETPLPTPPEIVHIMLDYKVSWVEVPFGPGHQHFPGYPHESLEAWHRRHGMWEGDK
ncbi:MAG: GFA family protein [Proteobacteria bacterium]|nr:GFA family protein [Pseudomonadota bacterium]MDA1057606.1 GFA family protein [Pseudomonadota bacterium]